MILIADPGIGVDLEGVVIDGRVLKESVVRIKHFLGQEVEPFSGNAAIVKANLTIELDPELCL